MVRPKLAQETLLTDHEVIRPARTTSRQRLPVLVWIFGGGLYTGSTADPQYNLSGITHAGQQIEKPVITGILLRYISHGLELTAEVSMNYRLGVWGFLQLQNCWQKEIRTLVFSTNGLLFDG